MPDSDANDPEQLSDRATVEWFPDADPPVYVVRTFDDEIDHEMEVYLEPGEVEELYEYHDQRRRERKIPDPPYNWTETTELSNGISMAKRGGVWHILDENGDPITKGHHKIYLGEDGRYMGKIGQQTEPIELTLRRER